MTITVLKDETETVLRNISALTGRRVLVGIPESTAERGDTKINNAMLGYIHEFGSPARNIPARPFLLPGVRSIKDKAAIILKVAALKAFDLPGTKGIRGHHINVVSGSRTHTSAITQLTMDLIKAQSPKVLSYAEQALNAVGILASQAVHKKILSGIPPGLQESTLRARARRQEKSVNGVVIAKGAIAELAYRASHPKAGLSMVATTPLVDSGKLLASVTYVIRRRSPR